MYQALSQPCCQTAKLPQTQPLIREDSLNPEPNRLKLSTLACISSPYSSVWWDRRSADWNRRSADWNRPKLIVSLSLVSLDRNRVHLKHTFLFLPSCKLFLMFFEEFDWLLYFFSCKVFKQIWILIKFKEIALRLSFILDLQQNIALHLFEWRLVIVVNWFNLHCSCDLTAYLLAFIAK